MVWCDRTTRVCPHAGTRAAAAICSVCTQLVPWWAGWGRALPPSLCSSPLMVLLSLHSPASTHAQCSSMKSGGEGVQQVPHTARRDRIDVNPKLVPRVAL